MYSLSPLPAQGRLLRAMPGQRRVAACPQRLDHLLLLTDRHPDTRGTIDFTLDLAERFHPRLTLIHGGNLRAEPAFWTSASPAAPDPGQTRLALLGLLWEVRKRWPEVGLCTVAAQSPEEVLQTAGRFRVDLLVVPATLFERFVPLVDRHGAEETVQGAPCPVLVVEATREQPLRDDD
ncbi:MAG: universal stress protein [Verrucomicrobia bacterium]|nr:universal stress protein [Verrucomicrobiota bacterium]